MPSCSYCHELGLECLALDSSRRCRNCVSANRSSCDVWGVDPSAFDAMIAEKQRLDQEKEAIRQQKKQLRENSKRVREQQRALEARFRKVVARELRDIDELEREEGPSTSAPAPPSLVGVEDFASSADFSYWAADPSLLDSLDAVGGTAGASQGNSGS
ncbi:hypothetical protein QBC35DRAFT_536747 [Podospora australis]|uniref:Uncharacterized protein n=1 Tax=Podospora australis TaxID=1536484 RepID=A0AAN6WIS6_9PEZI|nr:hypothetical protein QBC35DRAFT_536747 [Podospora australis]